MNLSIDTSLRKPNTSLTQFQLNELESMLDMEGQLMYVIQTLLDHTTCESATFELERMRYLLGKANETHIRGIVERVLFQSIPLTKG
jgi:hypothetical protein